MFPETSKPNPYKELFSALTPNKLLGFDAYLIIKKRRKVFFIEREVRLVRGVCFLALRAYSRFCSKVFPFIFYARLDLD